MSSDIRSMLYDSHMHTPLCRHAVGEPEEYAAEALRKGLAGIIFTCHNPIPGGYQARFRMAESDFETYIAIVERARQAWQGRIDVRLGMEIDYSPVLKAGVPRLLERAEFQYILGSVHCHIPEYRARYDTGSCFDFQKIYFEHMALAAETGFFDALSHPDLIKNLAPEEWDFVRIRPHLEKALDRIAATGVAMELNTSGLQKQLPEMNPGIPFLKLMLERNIPVVPGSDSHVPGRVGADFQQALRNLQEAGYEEVSYYTDRQRRSLPIEPALASLR